jgi:peptide deformylase
MMKLPLTYYGNPILRQKASPILTINDEIRELVQNMIETVKVSAGCGLAGPQVGYSLSLFITYILPDEEDSLLPGVVQVFINPKIIEVSKEHWICKEGCLSIPGLERQEVSRPAKVKIQAMDLDGHLFEKEFTEFEAHVILHENDHLNGVLFIDRLDTKKKKKIEVKLAQIKKKMN